MLPCTQTPTTWEDVLRMPDDGNRYEVIGGRLYMTPAPVTRHQRVLARLWSALFRILVDSGRGEAFCAPLLVQFPGTGDRVQPDLLFISGERRAIIGEKQVTGAPDLVVEILSPSTAHRDRGIKLDLYARHGVRQYWIADPDEDVVDVRRFADEPGDERFSGKLPVRLGRERLGLTDLGRGLLASSGPLGEPSIVPVDAPAAVPEARSGVKRNEARTAGGRQE